MEIGYEIQNACFLGEALVLGGHELARALGRWRILLDDECAEVGAVGELRLCAQLRGERGRQLHGVQVCLAVQPVEDRADAPLSLSVSLPPSLAPCLTVIAPRVPA